MNEIILTTGQISGLTMVGYMSLYRYVRDFPEFFSPPARQHKRGRRWTVADLELVQGIRYLYHERKGKNNIRQMLKDGWRPEANSAYHFETLTRLIEATLAVSEDAKRIVKDAQRAIDDVKFLKKLSYEDHYRVNVTDKKIQNFQSELEQIQQTIKGMKRKVYPYA